MNGECSIREGGVEGYKKKEKLGLKGGGRVTKRANKLLEIYHSNFNM